MSVISEKRISKIYNELRKCNSWKLMHEAKRKAKRKAIVGVVNHFAKHACEECRKKIEESEKQ